MKEGREGKEVDRFVSPLHRCQSASSDGSNQSGARAAAGVEGSTASVLRFDRGNSRKRTLNVG